MKMAAALDDITDPETLRAIAKNVTIDFRTSKERIRELENMLLLKEERIAELPRERWGRSSGKRAAGEKCGQADLFDEIGTTVREETGKTETTSVRSHTRKRGKRARLPAELPRIETVIDIDEAEKACGCGETLGKIGEDISGKLEVIPARFIVRRTIRPRCACRRCGGTENEPERPVAVAPLPPSILPKTNATPSLLATIATWKFQDALPLHRQEHWPVTASNWVGRR